MNSVKTNSSPARSASQKVTEKREAKRHELTEKTLHALAKLGFVEASMRTIARELGVSQSVLQYYFDKKNDMISQCMTLYKSEFVNQLIGIMTPGADPDTIFKNLTEHMIEQIEQDAALHRLWYDMRVQALYSEELSATVAQFEEAFINFANGFVAYAGGRNLSGYEVYIQFDGLFFAGIRGILKGEPDTSEKFMAGMTRLYEQIKKES